MAKIKEIGVMFGVSQSTGPSAWLKTEASITIEFDKGDADEAIKDDIWAGAWERVTDECSSQLAKFDAANK